MFPARAGMNRTFERAISGMSDVPRTGGDEPLSLFKILPMVRCSPHGRG